MSLMRAYLVYASYWIRPFDVLADKRIWVWQKRMVCAQFVCRCYNPKCEAK